ncbi:MAG: 16S rRNA (uracil(1498)-N(3))-methyltransferase [Thermacetogeniaceae bacterium]|nr:16S rRNA (uracil(1498)-N(3))-methyltransferase [Syntrophomonadaceae bacterium]
MHRFYVPAVPLDEDFPLPRRDAKKILRVLRLSPGEEILLWDDEGREYRAQITRAEGMSVYVKVLEEQSKEVESPLPLVLVQGIPKGDKFEFIIQKATELGVWRVYPALTERTIVRIPPERQGSRRERWQSVAREAARQSGRVQIPEIMPITTLTELVQNIEKDAHRLILWEGEKGTGLKDYLRQNKPNQGAVYLFVGPEGGFSRQEVDFCINNSFTSVTLGPRILRTETAGLVSLSLILYEWGDLGG